MKLTTKQQHNISKIVDINKLAAKKSGLTMTSVTICRKKKRPLTVDCEKNEKWLVNSTKKHKMSRNLINARTSAFVKIRRFS